MQPIRADDFTKTEADVAALSDGPVSATTQPAGVGGCGIKRMLSARLQPYCNTSGGGGTFDLHVLHGHETRGGAASQYVGELTKIGELVFVASTTAKPADDTVAPGKYPPATLTWTPTSNFTALVTASGDTGTAVINLVLHLMCLGKGHRLIAKPRAFSGAGVTANLLVDASRP